MCVLQLVCWLNDYETHGTTIKIVNAQQAKLNNNYKNAKLKLLKTNVEVKQWVF